MQEIFTELQQVINDFPQQFSWQPELKNLEGLPSNPASIAICGMGGSALAANLLLSQPKAPDIRIHRDYWHNWLSDMDLVVISSYSGNTEEMIDVYNQAKMADVEVAVITAGGQLLDLAIQDQVPYIKLADAPQPRYAIGYSYIAMSKIVGTPLSSNTGESLATISANSKKITDLAQKVAGKQVVYYATPQNFSVAYVWKILTNESAKQMAWVNKFPEFNHNELNGYFTSDKFELADNLAVVILSSNNEHDRNRKRMDIIKDQLVEKGITVIELELEGDNVLERAVYGWQAGMYFTLELARANEVNPKEVKIIEDLKEKLKS